MPQCAAFVDEMRKAFGADQVDVLLVREGGREWRKPRNRRVK